MKLSRFIDGDGADHKRSGSDRQDLAVAVRRNISASDLIKLGAGFSPGTKNDTAEPDRNGIPRGQGGSLGTCHGRKANPE